jgi:hypothetical protein
MPNFFSPDFSDYFCRSYRIWLLYNCRRQKVDPDVPAVLEKILFSPPPRMEPVSPFARDLCVVTRRSAMEALLSRSTGPVDPEKVTALLEVPLSDENNWELVVGLYLHDRLRTALGWVKSLERFYPRDLFGQAKWRINKVVNSLGQLHLPEPGDDDRTVIREIVSGLYGTPFSLGLQPGFNPAFHKETVQSLGHVLDTCVPKAQFDDYDNALFIHRNLEALALSGVHFHCQVFFLIEILDNFNAFLDRFNAGQA